MKTLSTLVAVLAGTTTLTSAFSVRGSLSSLSRREAEAEGSPETYEAPVASAQLIESRSDGEVLHELEKRRGGGGSSGGGGRGGGGSSSGSSGWSSHFQEVTLMLVLLLLAELWTIVMESLVPRIRRKTNFVSQAHPVHRDHRDHQDHPPAALVAAPLVAVAPEGPHPRPVLAPRTAEANTMRVAPPLPIPPVDAPPAVLPRTP